MNEVSQAGKKPWRIAIVDSQPIVRAGIVALLAGDADYEVVCEAGDEAQAPVWVARHRPDLIIVELALESGTAFSLFERMLRAQPQLRILVFSMYDEAVYAEKVLQAGAHGYLMKREPTATLREALRTLLSGQRYVSNDMRDWLLSGIAWGRHQAGGLARLTRCELTVLSLIGQGLSSREIADRLKRSIKTIDVHRANLRQKLNLPSNAALVRFAMQQPATECSTAAATIPLRVV